jgi:hypothetical protein
VGFVVDKVVLGQVFSMYFGLPCQSSFHQLLHNHPHLSSGASTIGQKWPQSHPTSNNKNKTFMGGEEVLGNEVMNDSEKQNLLGFHSDISVRGSWQIQSHPYTNVIYFSH